MAKAKLHIFVKCTRRIKSAWIIFSLYTWRIKSISILVFSEIHIAKRIKYILIIKSVQTVFSVKCTQNLKSMSIFLIFFF